MNGAGLPPRWRRLGWFVLIWALSALAVAGFAYALRAFLSLG